MRTHASHGSRMVPMRHVGPMPAPHPAAGPKLVWEGQLGMTDRAAAEAAEAAGAAADAPLQQSLYGRPVSVQPEPASAAGGAVSGDQGPASTSAAGGAVAIKQEPAANEFAAGQPAPYWVQLRESDFSEDELGRWGRGSTVACHSSPGTHTDTCPRPTCLHACRLKTEWLLTSLELKKVGLFGCTRMVRAGVRAGVHGCV